MAEKTETLHTLPLLPLKNSALFPGLMMPLSVGRKGSVAAVEAALASEQKELVIVAQRDSNVEVPGAADLFTVGTRAVIRKVNRTGASQIDIMVLGVERVVLIKVEENV